MKCVFTINNGFTELMAHHIININSLDSTDCLMIYVERDTFGRKPQIDSEVPMLVYNNGIVKAKPWRMVREIKATRYLVESALGGSDYICYANSTRSTLAQALINSSACIGYYIVEEGLGAYSTDQPEVRRDALRRYARRLLSRGAIEGFGPSLYYTAHQKFLGAIAASEYAFTTITPRQVVGWPFHQDRRYGDTEALLVFAGRSFGEAAMRDAVMRFATRCWTGVFRRVAYKFHPSQRDSVCQHMRAYLDDVGREYGLEFVELSGVVLENLCYAQGRGLSVYFITSSVGFYSAMMGCRAVSLARFYGDHRELVSEATATRLTRFLDGLPEALLSRVEFI